MAETYPVDVNSQRVLVDSRWCTRAILEERIQMRVAAGDFNVARLADALQQLNGTMSRAAVMQVAFPAAVMERLGKLADQQNCTPAKVVCDVVTQHLMGSPVLGVALDAPSKVVGEEHGTAENQPMRSHPKLPPVVPVIPGRMVSIPPPPLPAQFGRTSSGRMLAVPPPPAGGIPGRVVAVPSPPPAPPSKPMARRVPTLPPAPSGPALSSCVPATSAEDAIESLGAAGNPPVPASVENTVTAVASTGESSGGLATPSARAMEGESPQAPATQESICASVDTINPAPPTNVAAVCTDDLQAPAPTAAADGGAPLAVIPPDPASVAQPSDPPNQGGKETVSATPPSVPTLESPAPGAGAEVEAGPSTPLAAISPPGPSTDCAEESMATRAGQEQAKPSAAANPPTNPPVESIPDLPNTAVSPASTVETLMPDPTTPPVTATETDTATRASTEEQATPLVLISTPPVNQESVPLVAPPANADPAGQSAPAVETNQQHTPPPQVQEAQPRPCQDQTPPPPPAPGTPPEASPPLAAAGDETNGAAAMSPPAPPQIPADAKGLESTQADQAAAPNNAVETGMKTAPAEAPATSQSAPASGPSKDAAAT